MSESGRTTRRASTPKIIARVAVIAGLIWFVATSPKTPVQFFDAAIRDEAAYPVLSRQGRNEIQAKEIQIYENMLLVRRELNRMALLYDMIHDPENIHEERASIMSGFYEPSSRTHDAMMQNHRDYRTLAEKAKMLKTELRSQQKSNSDSSLFQNSKEEDKDLEMKSFQIEMDRMFLRQFQANLFWRKRP